MPVCSKHLMVYSVKRTLVINEARSYIFLYTITMLTYCTHVKYPLSCRLSQRKATLCLTESVLHLVPVSSEYLSIFNVRPSKLKNLCTLQSDQDWPIHVFGYPSTRVNLTAQFVWRVTPLHSHLEILTFVSSLPATFPVSVLWLFFSLPLSL